MATMGPEKSLDKLSQALISTWQTSVEGLKKDIKELGSCTAQVEAKMEEIVEAHNSAADKIKQMEIQLTYYEQKIMDLEDRSRHSNLRIRGVPESITITELPNYILKLFKTLAPEISTDMFLLDHLHRVSKPKHKQATLPRDVLLKAHYFHIKNLLLKKSRNKSAT
ncbi:Hypothetical predicted protein [Pelobates cultripes]|uniref:Uncharacterized protein n=1 Tax=Pelobates cultripes TaxID=61616 RepID=A0AAD1WQJ3_PELCU|nr:Hypothetical predicted protein [Pelobates cultripes]